MADILFLKVTTIPWGPLGYKTGYTRDIFTVMKFADAKGLIIIRKSKKDRQQNGQKKKDKQQSTKHTHKTKDQVTRTPLKTGGELRCSGW